MSELKGLFVVSTPIGNLKDITVRAVEILKSVDFIAAEDTRNTIKLLNAYEIKKPLISYYEHNKVQKTDYIIGRLQNGESCAIVTDAGTPAISDPGEDLVRTCLENSIAVTPVPGVSAAVTALSVSGRKTAKFCFEGFLSAKKTERIKQLELIKNEERTLVFYETPHRLLKTLEDMLAVLGNRKATVTRELTKIHEEILYSDISGAISRFEENEPRGEFVLVLEGAEPPVSAKPHNDDIVKTFDIYIKKGLTKKDAIIKTANELNLKKNEIYNICNMYKDNKI